MNNVLITGAAGFIGSQLAYRLWQNGEVVTLTDNFSYGSEDNLIFEQHDFRKEIYKMDIRNMSAMDELFAKKHFDTVYHIAAITPLPDCQNNPVEAVSVNVGGTVGILQLARKYGVKRVVFSSTSAVYENNTDFPSVEENVSSPSLIYPSTKFAAEQFCKAFSVAYSIPVICMRFANVYGPHIDCLRTQPPVMGYIIREFYKGSAPVLHSDGEQKRDFIYVDDLIDLALIVTACNSFDIVNVSSGTAVSINEILSLIAEEMKCTAIKPVYAETEHFWSKYPDLYEQPYPISANVLEHEILKYTCLSNKHAYQKYGWQPKTLLKDGIKRTVDFSCSVLEKADLRGEK